ncbi:MAG: Uma2 family endonuclease [Deltaproteobacteria bacterium]
MIASSRPRLTFEEYCQIEASSSVRHEFWDGQAWAMAGGSREHAALAANVVALLATALRGTPCQVHTSDLRVRVLATGLATYPDVSVICGRAELDPEDRLGHTVTNPKLLVEVLSPSTEQYDRGEKLAQYQRIESLRTVVLIGHAEHIIDVWQRSEGGEWLLSTHRAGLVQLASIGATLPVTEIYRDPLANQ